MKAPKPESELNPKPRVLATLKYASSNGLRTGYLTGLFAATTPEGSINVVGYVERQGFPERAVVTALPKGEGGIVEDEGGSGWIREIHNSFIISVATAEGLIEVLQEAIEDLNSREKKAIINKEKKG